MEERPKNREEALDRSMDTIKNYTDNEELKKMIEALKEKDNIEYNKIPDGVLDKLAHYNMNEYSDNEKKATK